MEKTVECPGGLRYTKEYSHYTVQNNAETRVCYGIVVRHRAFPTRRTTSPWLPAPSRKFCTTRRFRSEILFVRWLPGQDLRAFKSRESGEP